VEGFKFFPFSQAGALIPDPIDPINIAQVFWGMPGPGGELFNIAQNLYSAPLLAGASWAYSDRSLSAVRFDGGANGYIDLGTTALLGHTDPFSISWVENVRVAGAYMGVMGFVPSGQTQRFLMFRDDTDTNYRYLTASLCNRTVPNVSIFAGAKPMSTRVGRSWHSVLTGLNGMSGGFTSFRLYENYFGVLSSTSAGTSLGSFTGTGNLIGWDGVDNKFQGDIGAPRIWRRALTFTEIQRLHLDPLAGLLRVDSTLTDLLARESAPTGRYDRMLIAM